MHKKRLKNIIFINTHPIQYFAPLYKYCTEHDLPVEVWYCSDESMKPVTDTQFGVPVQWDIPLLEGYGYSFFRNYSWKPSHFNGFWGLINIGIWVKLISRPKSIIVIHGWSNITSLFAFIIAKCRGHKVCMRAETPWNQEVLKGEKNIRKKKQWLGKGLFRFVDYFLYIGTQNKLFYENMGVNANKLFYTPYAVDNQRFQQAAAEYLPQKSNIRQALDIPAHAKVILYSGKFMQKKRPMDLIKAFQLLNMQDAYLVMVGDGGLRPQMEAHIAKEKISNIRLTGFINQSEIPKYYAMADVFVMCSEIGETWGLSVNEAMNFNLPVIVSDLCGCSTDLVQEGINGFTYSCGDITDLSRYLQKILSGVDVYRHSTEVINNFSYRQTAQSLKKLISSLGF